MGQNTVESIAGKDSASQQIREIFCCLNKRVIDDHYYDG